MVYLTTKKRPAWRILMVCPRFVSFEMLSHCDRIRELDWIVCAFIDFKSISEPMVVA